MRSAVIPGARGQGPRKTRNPDFSASGFRIASLSLSVRNDGQGEVARYDFLAVYIMASRRNGTLYTGVTSDLPTRAAMHREGQVEGFTQKYGCKMLVWYEQHPTMEPAIKRETRIKGWRRAWKLALIEQRNPEWNDLLHEFS